MLGCAREFPVIERALRAGGRLGVAALLLLLGNESLQNAIAEGDTRTLSFHHIHTGEDVTVTFKRNGRYDDAALKKLDWLMRDWRRDESIKMDPHLFDLLWEAYRAVEAKEPIRIISGYRSPQTNAMLRARSSGVAQFSQHTHGQAMDFFIPGVPLEELRNIGLRMQRGGVGFYPASGSPFVHLDTGSVRHWPRMTHDQLVKLFPDGRTVHTSSDGQPLAGYALALADIERRGGSASPAALAAARIDGVNGNEDVTASVAAKRSGGKRNVFAKMFGFGKDEDEDADAAVAPPPSPRTPAVTARAAVPPPVPIRTVKVEPAPAPAAIAVPLPHARPAPVAIAAAPLPAPLPPPRPVAVASVKSEDVIAMRGYWNGAVEAGPALPPPVMRPARFETASADPLTTASVGSQSAERTAASMAFAYATPASGAAKRASPMGSSLPRMPAMPLVEPVRADTTIVVKQAIAPLSAPAEIRAAAANGTRFDDPWMRATMITPSAHSFLTATRLGAHDMRPLRDFMHKPPSSVVMTFSADPHYGMVAERFSGRAVVFLATATFGNRTAALAPR